MDDVQGPRSKGGPDRQREREKRKIKKTKGRDRGPESQLSTGPEHPRYATVSDVSQSDIPFILVLSKLF